MRVRGSRARWQEHVPGGAALPGFASLYTKLSTRVCAPEMPRLESASSRNAPLHTGSPLLSCLPSISLPFSKPRNSVRSFYFSALDPQAPPISTPAPLLLPGRPQGCKPLLGYGSGGPRPEARPLLHLGLLSPAPVRRGLPQAPRGPGPAQGRGSACGTSPRCAARSGWAS